MTFLSNGVFLLSCCVRLAMYNKDQSVYIYRSIYLSYQDRLGTNEKGTLSTKRKTGCSVSRQRTTYRNVVPHVRRGDSALPPCPSHRLHGRDATPAEARLLFVRPLLLVASDVRVQSLSWQMITFQNENKTEKMIAAHAQIAARCVDAPASNHSWPPQYQSVLRRKNETWACLLSTVISLCLSRACLGKSSVLVVKTWFPTDVSAPPSHALTAANPSAAGSARPIKRVMPRAVSRVSSSQGSAGSELSTERSS